METLNSEPKKHGRHRKMCPCEKCKMRRSAKRRARQMARSEPVLVAAPSTGSEKSRGWDKRLTIEVIASFSDDTIAELYWLGRDMEIERRKKHAPEVGGSSQNDKLRHSAPAEDSDNTKNI